MKKPFFPLLTFWISVKGNFFSFQIFFSLGLPLGWVYYRSIYEIYMRFSRSFYSSCDSRNLNLSPFCNLTSTSLAIWQESVLETYGSQTTSYIDGISGPMRVNFPNSMEERELITALVKVDFLHLLWTSKLLGGDVLQRLWEGYCHFKYLLWAANRIRWVH